MRRSRERAGQGDAGHRSSNGLRGLRHPKLLRVRSVVTAGSDRHSSSSVGVPRHASPSTPFMKATTAAATGLFSKAVLASSVWLAL